MNPPVGGVNSSVNARPGSLVSTPLPVFVQSPGDWEQGKTRVLFSSLMQCSEPSLCTCWVTGLVLGRLPVPAAFRFEGQVAQQGKP